MGTRKNQKSKKFRKTRSKRQSGGRLTQQYNNQEDVPNNESEEPAYQIDVPNNEEWVRRLDCPLNDFDEREVEYRWQQQTNRGLPGHLSGNKDAWRDICQDFVRYLTPEEIRIRRDEQEERRQNEEEIAEIRHRRTNGGKNKTRSKRGGGKNEQLLLEWSEEGTVSGAGMQSLLKQPGIDVNARNRYGITPLQFAIKNGHTYIVNQLLKKEGINVNAQNDNGVSVLQSIVIRRKEGPFIEIMKMLLKHPEIKVNVKDGDGVTPLYRACRNGHTTLIEMLLEAGAGAEVNAKWTGTLENGWTALIQALRILLHSI